MNFRTDATGFEDEGDKIPTLVKIKVSDGAMECQHKTGQLL